MTLRPEHHPFMTEEQLQAVDDRLGFTSFENPKPLEWRPWDEPVVAEGEINPEAQMTAMPKEANLRLFSPGEDRPYPPQLMSDADRQLVAHAYHDLRRMRADNKHLWLLYSNALYGLVQAHSVLKELNIGVEVPNDTQINLLVACEDEISLSKEVLEDGFAVRAAQSVATSIESPRIPGDNGMWVENPRYKKLPGLTPPKDSSPGEAP